RPFDLLAGLGVGEFLFALGQAHEVGDRAGRVVVEQLDHHLAVIRLDVRFFHGEVAYRFAASRSRKSSVPPTAAIGAMARPRSGTAVRSEAARPKPSVAALCAPTRPS